MHIGPGEAGPDFYSPRIFADGDVIKPGHRDVYTLG